MEKNSVIVLLAIVLSACATHEQKQHDTSPIRVKAAVVAAHTGSANTRYVGTIEPSRETPLSFQSAGRVVAVEVKNGQRIRQGQTIARIDNTQAMNALRSAEATLRHAQDGYDRVNKVHEKGVVSDQKMVEIESQLAQAKSLYAAAKQQVNECTLIAPCDGVVNGLNIEKGQTIIPGTTICTLLDVTGFSVRFSIPEDEIRNRYTDGEVECIALDTLLPITVIEKGMSANPLTHTYEIVARVNGGADILMNGMVGKVRMWSETGKKDASIVIPAKCILLKQEGPTVWLVEQGCAVRKKVIIDGYQADGVRIKGGLMTGDTLITDGYQKLYNHCKIEIVEN